MGNVVTIHQPNYLPWLGFFSKIAHSDCYVILDTVKYTKNGVINRNKIRTKDEWCYLTIPIEKKFHNSNICDVILPENNAWQKNHWKTIEVNYKKADYFDSYSDFFKKIYTKKFDRLSQINEEIIIYLLECLDITVDILKTSELTIDKSLKKTDLLIDIVNNVGGESYLSGISGKEYLDIDEFARNKIELNFFEFRHPIYRQRYQGFVPNMSVIDLIFNEGEKSKEILYGKTI